MHQHERATSCSQDAPEGPAARLTNRALILGLHHVGLLVPSIANAADAYARRYGYEPRTAIIHDPGQTAYVQFLQLPGSSLYLELVAPDRDHSKLSNNLRKGGGPNHLCYGTSDIEAACQELRAEQMILLQPPVPAAAFPGRRIAWLMADDRTPIELVEAGDPGDSWDWPAFREAVQRRDERGTR